MTELKDIREALGLSQEKMGNKLGITGASWHSKETYKRALKATELLDIMKLLEEKFPEGLVDIRSIRLK